MWIRDFNGGLINLQKSHIIQVKQKSDTAMETGKVHDFWVVETRQSNGVGIVFYAVLNQFKTESEAVEFSDYLAWLLDAKECNVPDFFKNYRESKEQS